MSGHETLQRAQGDKRSRRFYSADTSGQNLVVLPGELQALNVFPRMLLLGEPGESCRTFAPRSLPC